MADLIRLKPTIAESAADKQPKNPIARTVYPLIERREKLSSADFFSEYVAKGRPVVVSGAFGGCQALTRWTFDHLRRVSGRRFVKLKHGLIDEGVTGLRTVEAKLSEYLDQLESYESRLESDEALAKEVSSRRPPDDPLRLDRPPYLHDVSLLSVLPNAADDLDGCPTDYFPDWYRPHWLQFAQFFLGPTRSLTPLHFDCLLTHNLFCQVSGRKRFILLDHDQLPCCYRYRWRWCEVDAETPDFARHPLYREARVRECTVGPGDLLYMPPGMLHHVRSLDCALSFNVDWHTRDSAIRGVLALGRGMPLKNAYYNAVIALALCAGVSAERVLPWYRSYLSYVS
jgi:hypothetical protein